MQATSDEFDIVRDGIRLDTMRKGSKRLWFLIETAWLAIICTLILLALTLWRVW